MWTLLLLAPLALTAPEGPFPSPPPEPRSVHRSGVLTQVQHFDSAGRLQATVTWRDDRPAEVTVHGPQPIVVAVANWTPRSLGGWEILAPTDAPHFSVEGAEIAVDWIPGDADPFSEAFRDGLLATCACLLEGRTTTSLDGHPAARYRVRVPDPEAPRVGEIWAARDDAGTLLLRSLVPATLEGAPVDGPAALARGRVPAALVRREVPQ